MADTKLSGLTRVNTAKGTDLAYVGRDNGDGSFTSVGVPLSAITARGTGAVEVARIEQVTPDTVLTLSNCFDGGYDYYDVFYIVNGTVAGPNVQMRLEVSGTVATDANYSYHSQAFDGNGNTYAATATNTGTSFIIGQGDNVFASFFR